MRRGQRDAGVLIPVRTKTAATPSSEDTTLVPRSWVCQLRLSGRLVHYAFLVLNLDHLSLTSRLLGRSVPDMLFHYTNSGSLTSIVQDGRLWGGLPEQMNDASEIAQAFRWINIISGNDHLDRKKAGHRDEREHFADWAYRRTSETDFGYLMRDAPKTYVVSFSEKGDSLSQWRAYCPRSGGYCLGLPGGLIQKSADAAGWLLAPCIYDETDIRDALHELYTHHMDKWFATITPGARSKTGDGYMDGITSHVNEMIEEVRLVGHFIKNPSFDAEHEWRAVAFNHDHSRGELQYAPGVDGVRVFLPFDYANGTSRLFPKAPRPSIRIGPNAHPESVKFATRSLFEELVGEGNADVYTTSSSYR